MSYTISKLWAREVLDSRGNPTVEVEVSLSDGATGRAMVPSGASKGQREALELRDGDAKRYGGKGTLKAVQNVKEAISRAVLGHAFSTVQQLDSLMLELDGTEQKSRLGANAILGVSLAFVDAVASSRKKPRYLVINELMELESSSMRMPIPMMNILNGGVHANNGLEIQEFMIVPHGFDTFREALRAGVEVFHSLKKRLNDGGYSTAVGDEGGFAPALRSNDEALELICDAIKRSGYRLGQQIAIALDCAASSFYDEKNGNYRFRHLGKTALSSSELIDYYASLPSKLPIVSIEDGLDENDWNGWKGLTEKLSPKVQLVGDDIFVTDKKWVEKGIQEGVANAVLIKVNQVGTFTETFATMALCKKNNYNAVVSHRSGETEDIMIAHLAVASGCGQIKTGSLSRSERTAKYNELLRIEEWAQQAGSPIPYARIFS